jgi:hypothetical protein
MSLPRRIARYGVRRAEHRAIRRVVRRTGLWGAFKWVCTLILFIALLHSLVH